MIAGKLPVPSASYDSDAGWAERHGGAASIFFGKLDRARKSFVSRVEIRIPVEAFMQFWSVSSDFYEKLKSAVSRNKVLQETAPDLDVAGIAAERSHVEWATIPVLIQSGGQVQADFYSLAQGDIFMYSQHRDARRLEVNPVLRVCMTPAVLLWVMDSAAKVAGEFTSLGFSAEVSQ